MTAPMDIEALVPHRGNMLLISEIISYDERQAAAGAVVAEHWPLNHTGRGKPACAHRAGRSNSRDQQWLGTDPEPKPNKYHRGWIVGIKSAWLFVDRIAVGATIIIEARNQFQYDSFREIAGVARIGNEIAAEVILQLMQAEQSAEKVESEP